MKITTKKGERKIINKLVIDLSNATTEEEKDTLNATAIKKIYKSEACSECNSSVSSLNHGLCGMCVFIKENKN